MTKKALLEEMERLYILQISHCDDSYSELFHAVDVLVNLGLLDKSLKYAMVKKDKQLFQ